MEEDHSTPSSHTLLHMAAGLLPMAAAPLSLHSLAHTHVFSTLILLSHNASIYRHFMAAVPLVLLSNMAARLGMVGCLTIENGGCQ